MVAAAVACLSANRLRAVGLVVGSVFFLLLSMGPGSPVDAVVRALVPFWDAFRYAARVWLLGHLALLLLVAVELLQRSSVLPGSRWPLSDWAQQASEPRPCSSRARTRRLF